MGRRKKFTPIKRNKPTSEVRDKTDPAARADYEKMAAACIAAIAAHCLDVLLTFPWFVKFKSEGFPKGILVATTQTTNTYKVKAHKLLDWLHEHGYAPMGTKAVVESRRLMSLKITAIEKKLDMNEPMAHNSVSTNEGEQ